MTYRDDDRLELILELAAHLARRTDGLSRELFLANRDEIDLTAFRLAHIGEAAWKLADEVKSRHPHIDWINIYGMRNLIVHDYGAIEARRVWDALGDDLNALVAVCRTELGQA